MSAMEAYLDSRQRAGLFRLPGPVDLVAGVTTTAPLWFVPSAAFHLTTAPEDVRTYTFNRHVIKHHFCDVCGCAPFAQAKDGRPKTWPASA